MTVSDAALDRAVAAIETGELVVYPTETVYGLGADALDPPAVERVFAVKQRSRDNPLSLGVPSVEAALEYVHVTDVEHRFMQAFLPGPVTVVVEKADTVPDVLTGGRERVGVRVPDHEVARALLERVAPITATSANVSGTGSVCRVTELSPTILHAVTEIIDVGVTPGTESTVVDVANKSILRAGAMVDGIETWLAEVEVN